MSRLSDLLKQVARLDPALATDLGREVKALEQRRPFGLNFERHQPESVEMPGRPVRRGDKVRILPPRGSGERGEDRLWQVARVVDGTAMLVEMVDSKTPERRAEPVADLVVVAEFRDPIYPGLVSTGRVERGGDKPFHTVINAENYHALEALTYTHEGKIDAIYIDPPYNTGARDWKYNNDYVDGDDAYRHSKWLAFMERRLKLAKRLLNPENSVLVVTIDEKEYLRLGMLLEQTYPGADLQMVSVVTNSQGTPRTGAFSRVDEYAFIVRFGRAVVRWTTDDMLSISELGNRPAHRPQLWYPLIRSGTDPYRENAPNQFFPIFVDPIAKRVIDIGEPLPLGVGRESVQPPAPGVEVLWPLLANGRESRWQLSRESLIAYLEAGYARVGDRGRGGQRSFTYLRRGTIERIERGEIIVRERDDRGAVVLDFVDLDARVRGPKSVWHRGSHEAGEYGSKLLRRFLPDRKFPFPKALYAVEDTLRFFVADKPDAVVLDFFSGSGTTAHAVMRLNKQDGGRRQCISVTNNEVSAEEQKRLREQGLRPGDPEWEQWGICDYITKPRIEAAITGKTPDGEPIRGDYKFTDEFPMADGFAENAEFFNLTYEAPRAISHHKSFEAIAPLLWLRAGARGRRIDTPNDTFDVTTTYGVLFSVDAAAEFVEALTEETRIAFIMTDDERAFQMVCADLPEQVEPVRLYESYLSNFAIGGQE